MASKRSYTDRFAASESFDLQAAGLRGFRSSSFSQERPCSVLCHLANVIKGSDKTARVNTKSSRVKCLYAWT
jgi:hypothetical protein